jgi:zinc/manganese transport system permease protein
MDDLVGFLLFPGIAAVIFVGMHTWLGLQVLRRNVIFADLALAQLAALGATVAVAIGHAPASAGGFAYSLLFATFGAALLTLLRTFSRHVSQEAVIGMVYVVTTALTVLVIDKSPQGAEHVKKMLVGSILTIGSAEVQHLAVLYGGVGIVHFLFRRKLLDAAAAEAGGRAVMAWDLLFYATFGVVVTSSVGLAGVLLVFSFLIIPAVIGSLYSHKVAAALGIGWAAGIAASIAGFGASLAFDLPTGAVLVACFGLALLVAVILRVLFFQPAPQRRFARRLAALIGAGAFFLALLVQGVGVLVAPSADNPLVAAVEKASSAGPGLFMTEPERQLNTQAAVNEARYRDEVERLREMERTARWQGQALSEEQVLGVSSFQRVYNEMGQGERFVQNHLLTQARSRGRWYIGIPAIVVSTLGLGLLGMLLRPCLRRT